MNTTAAQFPPGYLDEYIGWKEVTVGVTFIILDTLFFALRFLSRYISKTTMGWDDWLLIPSLFFCVAMCVSAIVQVQYGGAGHHLAAVQMHPATFVFWEKTLIEIPVVYVISVMWPKLAICAIYLRVFVEKSHRIITWIVCGILISNCIADIFPGIFQCIPVAYFWDKSIPNGHCGVRTNTYYQWISLPNMVTDVIMLILPLPVVWKLQTSTSNKVGLTLTFMLGSIGLITSILRFRDFISSDALDDGPWQSVSLLIWTMIEPSIYHIAACLPACRPLILWFRNRVIGKIKSSKKPRGTGNASAPYELSDLGERATQKSENVKSKPNGFRRLLDSHTETFKDTSAEHIIASEQPVPDNTQGFEIESNGCMVESPPSQKTLHFGDAGIHVTRDYHVSTEDRL